MADAARCPEQFVILNGASGHRTTVRQTLDMLKAALQVDTTIEFNGTVRAGDPRFYHADVSKALALGWGSVTSLKQGIAEYASWIKGVNRD